MNIDHRSLIPRTPVTGNFITLDSKKCTLCGRCLIICVMNLWKKRGKTVHLVDDYASQCVECGACYQVCESGAIEFRFPPGGTGIVCKRG